MATKDYSSIQENMVASLLGWEVVAGSGAAACFPGDVIGDEWLGECKTHVEPGHKIFFSKDVWDKIKMESVVKHRFPALFTDDGTQKEQHTWCLCHCDRLDLTDAHVEPITKGVNKNISFNHEAMARSVREIVKLYPGKFPVFSTNWHGEDIAICQLVAFNALIGR